MPSNNEDAEIKMALALITTERLLDAIQDRFDASMFVGMRNVTGKETNINMTLEPHPAPDGWVDVPKWGTLKWLWCQGDERLRSYLNCNSFEHGLDT